MRAYRSLIRSGTRLTYPQAERILDGEGGHRRELEAALRELADASRRLREQRFARGAARDRAAASSRSS